MIGFIHGSNKYLYIRDVLQNILGIIDINGNVVVKYDCDAFGKINNITGSKASTIGKYNPFRYKGYYYDEESSMYYCKSRYYVPEWCRWLNADSPSFLETTIPNQMNLFTYCSNNPIANIDSNGKFGFLATLLISVAVNVVINLVTEVIEDVSSDGKFGGDKDGMDYLGAIAGGAISGLGTNPVVGVVTGTIGDMIDGAISGDINETNSSDYFINSLVNNAAFAGASQLAKKGVALIGGTTFSIMKKSKISNNKINRVLKSLTNGLNIGSKKATIINIAKKMEANKLFNDIYDGIDLGVSSLIKLISACL